MNCPHCNIALVMTERCGVEIDYCPQCRGIWLDKGELDKIIERSNQHYTEKSSTFQEESQTHRRPMDKEYEKHRHTDHFNESHEKHHKKKSWLGDIFDF